MTPQQIKDNAPDKNQSDNIVLVMLIYVFVFILGLVYSVLFYKPL